jgi:hypothetical protein
MYIFFNQTPAQVSGDKVIATALTGVVYVENNRLHVKCNDRHYLYKFDGSPIGWYARNLKTCDDIYLGEGVCPGVVLETLSIKDEEEWANIIFQNIEP